MHADVILHLPLETVHTDQFPGQGLITEEMSDGEIVSMLRRDLASVPGHVGVNNHMGSKFMVDEGKLVLVFNKLKKKKLFFVDSRTTASTKAHAASVKVNIPMGSRKVFLDNNRNYDEIYKILLESAQNSPDAFPVIMIGHPYPETIRAIKDASKVLREKGILVVPVSKLIKGQTLSGSS